MNPFNLLNKRQVGKFFAKKIIITSPFSIEYDHRFFPNVIRKKIKTMDENIQQWALAKSDIFSESDWREIQLNKLKKILVHAGRNVSYWRKLFKKISFNPENFRDFEDLQKIPIITRADIKKIPIEELTAKNIARSRFVEATTSGSTGEPLRLFQDARDIFRRRISTYETMRYMGFSASAKIFMIDLRAANGLRGLGPCVSLTDLESPELRRGKVYPFLMAYRPQILLTTPSCLERFLFFCQKDEFFLKVKAIVYIGESISAHLREHLEDFFSAKVFSAYGTREASPLGVNCNQGSLHAVPWMNYLEIIDENGNSFGDGRTGKIVVTSLENEVMPFIRYQIGDNGKLDSGRCGCGRQTQFIELDGRVLGYIELSGEAPYPVNYIFKYYADYLSGKIERLQIEQTDIHNLIVRYKPMREGDTLIIESNLNEYFMKHLNGKIKIKFKRVRFFLPNENGKTPMFIKRTISDIVKNIQL